LEIEGSSICYVCDGVVTVGKSFWGEIRLTVITFALFEGEGAFAVGTKEGIGN